MKKYLVNYTTGDAVIDLSLDTISLGKQALVFVNSKRSAESVAERIARKQSKTKKGEELAKRILSVLSVKTKQCERLAYCVSRGIAFHHAGLASKQRQLVEDEFKSANIKIICATPTLAAGVDTPAYRTIIRDYKRFSSSGLIDIPVLEYHQMAGRAGRPDFNDDHGQAIMIAKTKKEADMIKEKYLLGKPENIYSKVASLPVLRTYCLSLIATEICTTYDELISVFKKTFFAYQYKDFKAVESKISDTISQLKKWGFLEDNLTDDFVSANNLVRSDLKATHLGKRVSELYIDPLSANTMIKYLESDNMDHFDYLCIVCSCLEMRPLLRIRTSEYDVLESFINEQNLVIQKPALFDLEYENFLEIIKTARLLNDWSEEKTEDQILNEYSVRPGELRIKLELADWLLYSLAELARILRKNPHVSAISKSRTRLKHGVKEELLPLLKLKNIGRIRARKLYNKGLSNIKLIRDVEDRKLAMILGNKLAKDIKEQVGADYVDQVLPNKRKGQLSLQKHLNN